MILSLESLISFVTLLISVIAFPNHVPPSLYLTTHVYYHDSVTVAIETGTYVFEDNCPVERYFLDPNGKLKKVCSPEIIK